MGDQRGVRYRAERPVRKTPGISLEQKQRRLINERMIEEGYAVLYTFPPNVKIRRAVYRVPEKGSVKRAGDMGRNGLIQNPAQWRKEHPTSY